ncbi:hypothetical protein MASR2M78_22390 [Treponema sp.]
MFLKEGIDKITIAINPMFISPDINRRKYIDPKKWLTIHRKGWLWVLDIHCERLNPFVDFHFQIAEIIYELIERKVLQFPNNQFTRLFVHNCLDWFVYYVRELEFYFDFKDEDVFINEDENDLNVPEDEKKFIDVGGTKYSKDFRPGVRDSVISIYDRHNRQKKVNQLSYKEIESNPYRRRIEFRLKVCNCDYLHLDNLKGTYGEIISRYAPYLAGLFNRYASYSVWVNDEEHEWFQRINALSKKGVQRTRTTLKKSDKGYKKRGSDKELDAKWEMIRMIFRV